MKCKSKETGAVFEYLVWTGQNQREMFDFLTFGEKIDDYMSTSGEHFRIDFNYSPNGGLVIKVPPNKTDARTEPGTYIVKNESGFRPYSPNFFNEVFETMEEGVETKGPIEVFESQEQLEKCLREWQHILFLDGWLIIAHIEDEIVDPNGKKIEASGYNTFVFESSQANIQLLSEKAYYESNFMFKHCMEKDLVHELLHCKYAWIENPNQYYESVYLEAKEHQKLEEMAKSLIMAKYGVGYDYFM